jgi:phage terminase small subunit
LLRNVEVQERIAELRSKMEDEKIMDAAERRKILTEIARDVESSAQDKIRAIDTANKMDGLYIQKTQLSGAEGGPLVFAWEGGGDGK